MSSGTAQAVLPIAGAVVGGVAGGPAGATAGYSIGSGIGGAMNSGGSSNSSANALLGAQPTQAQTVAGPSGDNPFDAYGSASQAMPNVPSQQMNLPQGTSAPTQGFKEQVAGMPAQDKIGLATYAVQAYGSAQAQARARELADREMALRESRYIQPQVVQGPSIGPVSSQMGQFPSVNGGFSFGR